MGKSRRVEELEGEVEHVPKNNSSPSTSTLKLSGRGSKSRLSRFHFVVIFVFFFFVLVCFPPSTSLFFICLAYSPKSQPSTIYHVAISVALSPFLAGKPLEHLCIMAARLHSCPRSQHLSSFVLTFYLPLPSVKSYLQCPI